MFSMDLPVEWFLEFIDAFIDEDVREETEKYDCTEMMLGVFKAYAFFFNIVSETSELL